MHGVDPVLFNLKVSPFLGGYYLALAIMNAIAAILIVPKLRQRYGELGALLVGIGPTFLFVVLSAFAWNGLPPGIPVSVQNVANSMLTRNPGAVVYTVGTS
ncbi:MAG: hypothetical protein HY000_37945, partial [Planctomycetes bacterium]|nr:hypothetical protein [Planctomycetota bacterium]